MKPLKYVNVLRNLKNDPFGFIVDTLVAVVVNLLIPIPLAGVAVSAFRAPILGLLASLLALFLFMTITVGVLLTSPLILTSGFLQSITSLFQPTSLNIAPDTSFIPTSIPKQNPFGGANMSFTSITAYFHDPSYYLTFGKQHEGLDLIPSDSYYQQSKTWAATHQVVIFATINGTVNHYVDGYGGETVEITNNDGSLKAIYIHFSQVLVDTGSVISPGQPIGIMGATGEATGPHVHYQIEVKSGNSWVPVNPLDYITQ